MLIENPFLYKVETEVFGNHWLTNLSPVIEPERIEIVSVTSPIIWLVSLFFLSGIIFFSINYFLFHKKTIYLKTAHELLKKIEANILNGRFSEANKIPEIIKRVVLKENGREFVSSLYGEEWNDFLRDEFKRIDSTNHELVADYLSSIAYIPYSQRELISENDWTLILNSVFLWVEQKKQVVKSNALFWGKRIKPVKESES